MRNRLLYWTALILNITFILITIWMKWDLNWLILSFGLNTVLLFIWGKIGQHHVKHDNAVGVHKLEDVAFKSNQKDTKDFVQQVQVALANIHMIGKEQFVEYMSSISDDSIKVPLLTANAQILELRKVELQNNWIAKGVAEIIALKHKDNNICDYALHVISAMVKYLGANQACFFLLNENEDDAYFELTASYAYGGKEISAKRISPGEGVIGQVFYDKEIVLLKDVPADYVKITSGLGESSPKCICIVPLLSEGKIHGIIEIASFHTLTTSEIEYLKKVGENIGYNLSSIEGHRRIELLLKESQDMGIEVKSQEQELRQNMEELTTTQEQMKRKQAEMDSILSSLSVIELDLEGKIIYANDIFIGTTGNNHADIIGKHYNQLTKNDDPAQFEIMWNSILSGRIFSGEFKVVNSSKKEIWMAGNFTPVLDEHDKPYKVIVTTVFTTRDKEKMIELQEMVAAFKACLPVAEINDDMSFKSANDLFLTELGIRRLELKKASPKMVFQDESFTKLELYLQSIEEQPDNIILDVVHKSGSTNKFQSILYKLNNANGLRKKGLVILKNAV